MKKLITVLFLGLVLIPFGVKAASQKYNTLNFKEALTEEKIEFDLKNYKETDDQITIYLFRGNGCSYCRSFLEFLNSIVPEYGKYFKVVSYETWYDQANYKFMLEVSNFLGQPASGVPYIIIGDQVFPGYSSSFDEKIKQAIVDLYNSDDRYDVIEEMEKANQPEKVSSLNTWLIIGNLAIVILASFIIIYCDHKQHKILFNKLNKIEDELSSLKNTEVKNEVLASAEEEVKKIKAETKEIKKKTESKTKKETKTTTKSKTSKSKTASKNKSEKTKTTKK